MPSNQRSSSRSGCSSLSFCLPCLHSCVPGHLATRPPRPALSFRLSAARPPSRERAPFSWKLPSLFSLPLLRRSASLSRTPTTLLLLSHPLACCLCPATLAYPADARPASLFHSPDCSNFCLL